MSILSKHPDGVGYYYGQHKGARIDIRPERTPGRPSWRAYVNGTPIAGFWVSKDAAEKQAIEVIDKTPGEQRHLTQQERKAIHAAIKRLEYLSDELDCDELGECPMTVSELQMLDAIDTGIDALANSLRAKMRPTLAGGGRG